MFSITKKDSIERYTIAGKASRTAAVAPALADLEKVQLTIIL
jgi:hypothetical protein